MSAIVRPLPKVPGVAQRYRAECPECGWFGMRWRRQSPAAQDAADHDKEKHHV